MFDTHVQVLPMGQTMSDTPEAPRQSLGKRRRFGDEPAIEESEESAAANTLATLVQGAAAGSAGAGGSGSTCSDFADGPAAGLSAAPGSELADGGAALDRAAAELRDDFNQLEWIRLDDNGSESRANGGLLMDRGCRQVSPNSRCRGGWTDRVCWYGATWARATLSTCGTAASPTAG